MGCRQPHRSDQHNGQQIGERALESGSFAGNYAIVTGNFPLQKSGKQRLGSNLPRVAKIVF